MVPARGDRSHRLVRVVESRPANWRSGVVFPGVQTSTWTFDQQAREYYFHRFYDFQPDLDMDNPRVREEVRRIMGFWLQLGVAGFRMDAVPFVLEKAPRGSSKPQIHFEYLEEFRELLQWRVGDAVLLGEANVLPQETQPYFAGGDGLHMMFNFWVNQHLWLALATGDARAARRALRATRKLPPTAQWAHFLRNHDELDLGRLAAPERRQVFDAFAPEASMQLYGRGIRRRSAPMLGDAAAAAARLQPRALAARDAGPPLRRRDRHGREPPPQGARRDPNADAMVGGAATAASRPRRARPAGRSRGPIRLSAGQRRGAAARPGVVAAWTANDPTPQAMPRDRLGRLAHRPDRVERRAGYRVHLAWQHDRLRPQPRRRTPGSDPRPWGDTLANLVDVEQIGAGHDGAHHVVVEPYGYRWFRAGAVTQALARDVAG